MNVSISFKLHNASPTKEHFFSLHFPSIAYSPNEVYICLGLKVLKKILKKSPAHVVASCHALLD